MGGWQCTRQQDTFIGECGREVSVVGGVRGEGVGVRVR